MRIASQKSQGKTLKKNRRAFTLLEVLLAAAIGVLLMAALYVAMQVQLDHARAGRDAVEQSLLVRALLRRMSNDIAPGLAATLPATSASGIMSAGGSSSGGSSPSTSSSPSGSNPSTGSASSSSGGSASGSTGSGTTTSSSSTTPVLNLQGDSERLILWDSRISADLNQMQTSSNVSSDLRRITYWLAGGSSSPLGLARQEIRQATSEDALASMPPDIPGEASHVVAEEVQRVSFRYFDGTAWQDTWDGTQLDSSGASKGPPQAVEITLSILPPNSGESAADNANLKTYRHVVAIPTANGGAPATTTSTTQQ